jgi:hypothetical protein
MFAAMLLLRHGRGSARNIAERLGRIMAEKLGANELALLANAVALATAEQDLPPPYGWTREAWLRALDEARGGA